MVHHNDTIIIFFSVVAELQNYNYIQLHNNNVIHFKIVDLYSA